MMCEKCEKLRELRKEIGEQCTYCRERVFELIGKLVESNNAAELGKILWYMGKIDAYERVQRRIELILKEG